MNILHRNDGSVAIELSRRNLEHLLERLDAGGSPYLVRDTGEQGVLWVYGHEDHVHYADRSTPAGGDAPNQPADVDGCTVPPRKR